MKNTRYSKIILGLSTSLLLSGCGSLDRISNIGAPPEMSKINNPVTQEGYKPVSLPMPMPKQSITQNNSLWASDRQTFFKDLRAKDVGDLITVVIKIKDKAKVDNETERKRTSSETANLTKALGYEGSLNRILPEAIDPTNLIDGGADSDHKGTGTINRKEEIEVQLAALITQVLPNGNMVISGRQEVRVNFEKRILQIDGVIRPQDISVDNSVSYEKVAEARITYGGEGQLTDVQQPRYGQQLYDVIFPF
ncbi:MAG: flagellar basal body L-ring protein FlgH [Alphaproteobacteria bacterium]|nr:flagellar basal body L-ring protein FlgH [Alphaproteobacteria bacterium]